MKRRSFIKKTALGTAGLGLAGGLYTWQVEPFWLEFVYRKMAVAHLPDHLVGKTLMQISDVHVGNRFDYRYIIDSFQKARALSPDFVVYTGDYVNYENAEQHTQLDAVLQYAVRGKKGTAAVLGNHDYGLDWAEQPVADKITHQLESAGIRVLSNEMAAFNGLHIIGLDDYWALNFHPQSAFRDYDPSTAAIALCHNPDVCDLDVWQGYQGWILSGHTHGGQCKPPFLPPPMLPVKNSRYSAGEIDLNDGRMLYINRALGHLWQVRFNVRPEITVFTLERKT
ncbi:metallophosphoesterase [Ascidiimonas aurantiaca]|uniref:metallophosphoesterase n=1 Tax=Ascidiimonas aurantiaca TaxID=1685432 RepID=UPI0030ECFD9D